MDKKRRILVVDDDKQFLDEIREALTANGYEVTTLSENREVFDRCLRLRPDVIMLDIKMKDINGFQIADRLRRDKKLKDIPIIAVTGVYTEEEYDHIARGFGIRKRLIKPISIEDVINTIEKECGNGS